MRSLPLEARWQLPVLTIALLLFVAASAFGRLNAVDPLAVIGPYAAQIFRAAPYVVGAAFLAYVLLCVIRREPRPFKAIGQLLGDRFVSPVTAVGVLAVVAAVPVVMGSYGLLKMIMPLSRPFVWDDALARLDRALFLGTDPWRITHALLGAPLPTKIIDVLYTLWVPFLMVAVLMAAFARPEIRARYFLSFSTAWPLIGVVGAYLLSSAGPCFAAELDTTTADWFAPLMDRLRANDAAVSLSAVQWQGVLWQSHTGQEYLFARGISAAPSMHNAICMLYVLATAKSDAVVKYGARLFALIIWVGSVHTGWHYAVDGLIGWAMMIGIWKASGTYLQKVGYTAAPALVAAPSGAAAA